MRWTCCGPSYDKCVTDCYVRKGPWTAVRLSSRCRRHCGCRFDGFEGLVIYSCDVCITIPVCLLGGGVVPSEGSRFSTFSHCHAVQEMYDKKPIGNSDKKSLDGEMWICV